MKVKFWSVWILRQNDEIEDQIEILVLFISYWEVRETQPRRMRFQAEYFDLKFGWATQLSNDMRGSKYSAHHSWSSVLLIPLSYLIPTVKILNRLIWTESTFEAAQISLFTISTFFFTQLHRFLKRNSVKSGIFLFHANYIVPSNQSSALHASEGIWCEKKCKNAVAKGERPPTKSKFTYDIISNFFTYNAIGYWNFITLSTTYMRPDISILILTSE